MSFYQASFSKTKPSRSTIHDVTNAKRKLTMQIQHWEKIKLITKDVKEIAAIDYKIHKMRLEFLRYSCEFF
ncbi:hypothetical protein [Rachiplusia nu nucleopolyhedrovirus]|uniref:Uncharacterized protein n=1 Tax=Rachiplusia nu nucleopolyhedrovirus TaxID=2605775 RepID=A0AAF1DB26_9ABAC|nr:hypothetical protein QKQ55_gp021 [Rachiplusia nu nucleopolyhedrovirus]QEI03586.1 hypothetical protein [Rachiplusia nu nucleopolyhedrovirus]